MRHASGAHRFDNPSNFDPDQHILCTPGPNTTRRSAPALQNLENFPATQNSSYYPIFKFNPRPWWRAVWGGGFERNGEHLQKLPVGRDWIPKNCCFYSLHFGVLPLVFHFKLKCCLLFSILRANQYKIWKERQEVQGPVRKIFDFEDYLIIILSRF